MISADGMLFGALENCALCSGHLHYSGGMYKCRGFLTEWSKCAYSTSEPERVKGKWNIPEETDNKYLLKVSLVNMSTATLCYTFTDEF